MRMVVAWCNKDSHGYNVDLNVKNPNVESCRQVVLLVALQGSSKSFLLFTRGRLFDKLLLCDRYSFSGDTYFSITSYLD